MVIQLTYCNLKIFSVKEGNYINCLEIRESKSGEISIPDLITVEVNNLEQAMNILHVGLRNRAIGCTMHNAQSSRSHSIFQILLHQRINEEEFAESTVRKMFICIPCTAAQNNKTNIILFIISYAQSTWQAARSLRYLMISLLKRENCAFKS